MTAPDYAALVERLRKDWDNGSTESLPEAIDAIERLVAEIGSKRETLLDAHAAQVEREDDDAILYANEAKRVEK